MSLINMPNLLIVDDNKENLALLRTILRKMQVNLIEAQSGTEALEKISGIEIALAIIDVQMPGMDGYKLATLINIRRADARVPIIFLTASYFNETKVIAGYESGAVDYIFKPVSGQILISKINVFLDLFIQKQTVVQNVNERIKAERRLIELTEELEERVKLRTKELMQLNSEIQQIRTNYETFFNTIDDFLFVLNDDWNIIYTNSTVQERLGYKSKTLIGKSIFIVHPPDRFEEAAKLMKNIFHTKETAFSIPLLTRTGEQIPVETKFSSGIWDGKPAIFIVTKDVSKIKFSEEKFSKVFHLNPSACGLSSLDDYKYIQVNKAFSLLFGFDQDEVIGKTAMELGIMSDETRNSLLQKADNTGKINQIEASLNAKNGDIKHVIISAENINVQNKNFRFTVVHDITKRKQMEKALKKSEARLNKAQNIAHIGSWELDESTQDLKWSDETFRIFGFEPDSVKPTMELFMKSIHPDGMPALLEAIEAVRNFNRPYSVDHQIVLQDGQVRFVHENAEINYDQSGRVEKWFGTVQDISERKKNEAELKKSIEELHQLAEYVERVREEERVAISRELHDDLGQALTAVKIDLGLIRQIVSDKAAVLKISKVSDLVTETIRTVQRLTSELRPPIIDDLGLKAAIEWYANEFEQRNGIKMNLDIDNLDISTKSSLIIYRIMQESLTNIARHAKATRVDIVLTGTGEYIDFKITDNGIGITDKDINSKKSFGIISMKERSASQGGTFDISYTKGLGTIIKLKLPLKNRTHENSDLR